MLHFDRPDLLKECPHHPHNRTCGLCEHRQPDLDCRCDMCLSLDTRTRETRAREKAQHYREKMGRKIKEKRHGSWQLQYVLKKLLPNHNKTMVRPFGVFISEICFYKDGEANALFLNGEQHDRGVGIRQPFILRIKKEKLTNTQIQKILNERRRKYREKVGTINRQKSIKNKFGKKEPVQESTKDAVVIASYNKEQSYEELHEENYFIGMMLRRKQDPVFKTIDFIKNFIGVRGEDKRVVFCKYEHNKIVYKELFERSKQLMQVLGSNIIQGEQKYISADDEALFVSALSKEDLHAYAFYTLYKIVNYIEYFHDQKITLISVKFILNEINELYLLHVYNVEKQALVKYSWTHETYLKKIAQTENKILERMPKIEMDERSKSRSELIEKEMKTEYEHLKEVMGLAEVEKDDQEEVKNNAFFAKIHPELDRPISELLKDKNMTVHKFQKNHLGYFKHKKPLVAPFNSNLVKTLHKLTPVLKVTKGHEIQDPIIGLKTQKSNWAKKRSMSQSQGNTISTFNKTMTIFL